MRVHIGKYPKYPKSEDDRKVSIRIDPYDTWSMDHTLALIIHPMLIQLKETKHGSPWVDDEDVPEYLRSTAAEPKENEWDTDSNLFDRWDWVLSEMIWAFERIIKDDGDTYYYEKYADDEVIEPVYAYIIIEDGTTTERILFDEESLRISGKINREKHLAFNERQKKALIMFGKYYRTLWD